MNTLKKTFCVLAVLFGFFGNLAAMAADFACSPIEVAVYRNRIHVKCSASANDGTATIWYWAVSTVEAHAANRFLSTATTALVSGRKLNFEFGPGDTSGQSFGCLAKDCRTPSRITIF